MVNFAHYKKEYQGQLATAANGFKAAGAAIATYKLFAEPMTGWVCKNLPGSNQFVKKVKVTCGYSYVTLLGAGIAADAAILHAYNVWVELNTNDCALQKVYHYDAVKVNAVNKGTTVCTLPGTGDACADSIESTSCNTDIKLGEEEVFLLEATPDGIFEHEETETMGCVAEEHWNSVCGKPFYDQTGACVSCSCGAGFIGPVWYESNTLGWNAAEACRIDACSKWADIQKY